MPEPSCGDNGGGSGTRTVLANRDRQPRPRPRLSLVSTNALNIPPYENVVTNGWRDTETTKFQRKEEDRGEDIEVCDVMAASSYQPKLSATSRGGAGTRRRATLSLTPSSTLHSNIPVPQKYSATRTTSAAIEDSKLKCATPRSNSPRLVTDKTVCQLNANGIKIPSCKVAPASEATSRHVEVTQTFKKVQSTQLKRVTMKDSCGAIKTSSDRILTRSLETLPTTPRVIDDGGGGNDATKEIVRKSEYRKSVSIPPHLVAHLTSKFNALSERCHKPLALSQATNGDIKVQTPSVPNGNNVLTTKTKADVKLSAGSLSAVVKAPPTGPIMTQDIISPSLKGSSAYSSLSWIQRPKPICATMRQPITRTVVQPMAAAVDDNDNTADEVNSKRTRKIIDDAVIELPNVDDESRLTSVKQAIHNYEVAFLKSSTSSPELQRRLSFAKCDDRRVNSAASINPRSRTLPTAAADISRPSSVETCKTGGATLPNIPYRSLNPSFDGRSSSSLLPRAVVRNRDGGRSACSTNADGVEMKMTPVKGNQTQRTTSTSTSSTTSEITSSGTSISTKRSEVCNRREIFRAKPAIVVAEKLKAFSSDSIWPKVGDGSLRAKRPLRPCVSDENADCNRSSLLSLDKAVLGTEMSSMDLLAEIESHPSLVRMSKKGSISSASSSSSSSVAPNVSFLWKESTQTFVQAKVSTHGSNSSVDSGSVGRSARAKASNESGDRPSCDEDVEEPLYEELFNFTSRSQLNCKRPAMELPANIPIEDFSTSSDDSSLGEEMITYYLESQKMTTAVEDEDNKGDGNESWTDYSESDDGQSKTSNSSCKAKLRPSVGKRRRNGRNLMRRSWSQSLRDLANVHRNEGMSQQECVSDIVAAAGWEEVVSSDGSAENADAKLPPNDIPPNECDEVTDDTEVDDKSLTSIAREEAYEIQETRKTSCKERKVKKIKRNWTWSKTEFKLDISSTFEKIKLTSSKKPHQSTENASVELSPTKKSKQWNLKAKFAQMKAGGSGAADAKGERSPSSYTQFYVPTCNEDGTLTTSPCSEESPKSDAESKSLIPVHEISSTRESSSRRLRRVSSGGVGMVARPKTAPPAPPTAGKCGSSPSPVQALSDNTNSSDFGYGSQTWSTGSLNYEPVQRFNSDVKHTRSLKSDAIMTSATFNMQQRRSVTSESSSETCNETEDKILVNGEIMKDVAKVIPMTLSERENRISQLELPAMFPPDVSRLSCKLSPFNDEPLYQFYNAAARLRAAHENQVDEDDLRDSESPSPYYESIYQMQHGNDFGVEGKREEEEEEGESSSCRKTTAMELVRTTAGGVRTLWCEVPEVRSSGVLDALSVQKRRLQEAMFEVITSEASYLKSLNVLVDCFVHCPLLSDDYSVNCVLSRREGHVLFSDVMPVRETSERLLADLERRWQESIVISDICDILLYHATKHFEVYVKYCSNQLYQDRCLKKLKETNPAFVEVVRKLELSPACQLLSMHSFLMLPMQRITRLPLLVDAIFQRLDYGTQQYDTCKHALATLNKIVHECNEGAHRMERMEEMLNISRQLDFRDCRCLALISASRWLVKRGELTRLVFGDSSSKLSFGRRCAKQAVYLFLFTDLLIVTKKKSDDCYNVLDYCPRNLVQAAEIESPEQLPGRMHDGSRNIFQLSMLQNHDKKTVEMFFSCPKESDLTRWVEAVTPRKSENPDERIYEEWDCPQVQVIHMYAAQQPDELSLEESDVVNVFRKMADGWYQGERIRDGVQGWFPSNYTVEIVSSHIRARNLRQRYRLLALSHSYVENQRKKELSKTK